MPDATKFREMFAVLHNLSLSDLENAGVITPNAVGGSDWRRFNNDLTTFVLKLDGDRVARLAALVGSLSRSDITSHSEG